ncbi:hypothetical protein FRC00_009722, partial [Tulasnella sp. 408]
MIVDPNSQAQSSAASALTSGTTPGPQATPGQAPQVSVAAPTEALPPETPIPPATPNPSSSTTVPFLQATPVPTSAPDPTAPLCPYGAAASNPGLPHHPVSHSGPSLPSPIVVAPSQVAFGPPPNTIVGHPIAIPTTQPISYSTSGVAFLSQQHPTPHLASSASLLAPSSPLPTFAAAQQHASQQRTSAATRHRAAPGLRSHSNRRVGSSGPIVGSTIPVIAILYPIAFLTVSLDSKKMVQSSALSLAVKFHVSRDTDTLLLIQQRVREQLESGPAQLHFIGLDGILANATTTYDRT